MAAICRNLFNLSQLVQFVAICTTCASCDKLRNLSQFAQFVAICAICRNLSFLRTICVETIPRQIQFAQFVAICTICLNLFKLRNMKQIVQIVASCTICSILWILLQFARLISDAWKYILLVLSLVRRTKWVVLINLLWLDYTISKTLFITSGTD